jgi:MFS family permease
MTSLKTLTPSSPFQITNIRCFIAFRVFFNARFYYPVFTILFLDFGLTLEHFALLNVAWAATIVILEVPSGALADIFGRKRLLVFAGAVMVVEIALLCFAPVGNASLLFTIFLINRILSGAAEAAASGADEALAYDSLKIEGHTEDWGRVLERQMIARSVAYIGAMILGAAVYDPALMQRVGDWIGLKVHFNQALTMRFPLFLTLMMAIMALVTTLRMKEAQPEGANAPEFSVKSAIEAFRLTFQAGRWILKTPFALVIIAGGLMFDHVIRMLMTLRSQYLRVIDLPEASFGLIGAGFALMGLVVPKIAMKMADRHSPVYNLIVMAALTWLGLLGMTFCTPVYGLLPVIPVQAAMYMNVFFISHYLNRMTRSDQRATVLSFKGLSINLAYGLIGIAYSLVLASERIRIQSTAGPWAAEELEQAVFIKTVAYFPWYFLVVLAVFIGAGAWLLRRSGDHRKIG